MTDEESKLVETFQSIKRAGGFRYRSTGPRSLSNAVANHFGEKSESQLQINGTRVFTTRLNTTTRFSLFAKVADWSRSACNSSAAVLERFGDEQSGLNAKLNCTIEYGLANSYGLSLGIDEIAGTLFVTHKSEPGLKAEVWNLSDLEKIWRERKESFAIVEFFVEKEHGLEVALPSRLTFFKDLNPDFEKLLKNRSLTLDHLLSKSGGRVREKGPLFKLSRTALDACYKTHNRHVL